MYFFSPFFRKLLKIDLDIFFVLGSTNLVTVFGSIEILKFIFYSLDYIENRMLFILFECVPFKNTCMRMKVSSVSFFHDISKY